MTDTKFDLVHLQRNSDRKTAGVGILEPMEDTSSAADLLGLPAEHILGYAYGGMRPHSRHEHVQNPNSVLIHNHLGIEVLSLTSGQPLTQLTVEEEKVVYVDINEDGVLDRVATNFADNNCEAEVTSLPPDLRALFARPLCEAPSLWGSMSFYNIFYPDLEVSENTKVALPPTVVKR